MYFTLKEHNTRLQQLVNDQPKEIVIVSYGLYAGILDDGRDAHSWGKKFTSNTHLFLDSLKGIPTQIAVGLPPPSNCFTKKEGVCPHCQEKYLKGLRRLWHHHKMWPDINWRVCLESHMKAWVFTYRKKTIAIIGGRNLTDSDWHDFTMEIVGEKAEDIKWHCEEFVEGCLPMNSANLKKIAVDFKLPISTAAAGAV